MSVFRRHLMMAHKRSDLANVGKTILITNSTNSAALTINGVNKTYETIPNEVTKIIVDEPISSLANFAYRISTIKNLDLTNLKIDNTVSLRQAFLICSALDSLLLPKLKVNDLYAAFDQVPKVTSLDLSMVDISNVTALGYTFYGATRLKTLDISTWNFNKVTSITTTLFLGDTSLENLKFGYNLKTSISFSSCPLTHDSALSVINGLAEVTTTKTVIFKQSTYDTLIEDEIAMATDKGWSVVSA